MPTLREIREENYISRRALAKEAGVSESTIIRMEEGEKHTTEEIAAKVLHALSKKIGKTVTVESIEGLKLYNPLRDRKYPTKAKKDDSSEAA
jgi:predicted transcriptional regulator